MCQDGLGSGGQKEEGEMICLPKDDALKGSEELSETPPDSGNVGSLPRSTTGVIRIMRAKGRPEIASLVEELHEAELKVAETTERAKDLLYLLRTLHRKATNTYPTVKRNPVKDDA